MVKSLSIFSRPQQLLGVEDVEPALVVEQGTFSAQEELLLPVVDWVISISSATTLNSNNSAKSYNNSPKCSSLSSNKSAQETHNWHS